MVLILLLIFCSKQGTKFDVDFREERLSDFVYIQSFLLLIENFFRCPEFPRKEISYIEKFIPLFLQKFKDTIRRKEGMGWNFVKFHHPTHIAHNLRRFGPCASTDSSIGEHNHIYYKKDSKRTSGNSRYFEQQVGVRQFERLVLYRTHMDLEETGHIPNQTKQSLRWSHRKYFVHTKGMYMTAKQKDGSHLKAQWNIPMLGDQVSLHVRKHILPQIHCDHVFLFTRAYVEGVLYHGEPEFPPCECTEGGWHDWAFVHWQAWGDLHYPSRIIVFLELHIPQGVTVLDPNLHGEGQGFTESGLYALVHASADAMDRSSDHIAHQSTRLVYNVDLSSSDGQTVLYLVHVPTMLKGPCVAVPRDPEEYDHETKWMVVEPREEWNRIFFEWMREQTKNQ